MNDFLAILEFVVTAVWHVLPVFVFSVFLGVIVQELKLDQTIRSALNGHPASAILTATAIGAFSPFCSCTVIPVVNSLLRSGIPLAPVMAFWIASPTMDPEIFTLSVAILGWPLGIARLAGTLILSLAAGFLTLALTRNRFLRGTLLRRKVASSSCCSKPAEQIETVDSFSPPTLAQMLGVKTGADPSPKCCSPSDDSSLVPIKRTKEPWWISVVTNLQTLNWGEVGREVASQSFSLGGLLVLAFTLEALIDRYVPQTAIASSLGGNNIFSVPLAALIGIPLYLNNVTALPIVSGLLQKGMQPGAAIAFLIAGPVTTIPAMTAVWGLVQPRVFSLYLGIGLSGAIVLGLLTNILLSIAMPEMLTISIILSILLVSSFLLRRFILKKILPQRLARQPKSFWHSKR
jgi:uncharacterized protein